MHWQWNGLVRIGNALLSCNRSPSGPETNPHRGLVPWLSAGMAHVNGVKLALDYSRIGDTYVNPVPIHLEDWPWAGVEYDVRLVQFILRADQLATRIEACSIG